MGSTSGNAPASRFLYQSLEGDGGLTKPSTSLNPLCNRRAADKRGSAIRIAKGESNMTKSATKGRKAKPTKSVASVIMNGIRSILDNDLYKFTMQ